MTNANTTPRLFVPDALHTGAEIAATPAQAHHLGTVLRQAPGAALRLFNGNEGEWSARLTAIRRSLAERAAPE